MTQAREGNRRTYDRIHKNFSSSVRTAGGRQPGVWTLVFVKNISAGGILFNAEQPSGVGDTVELRIDMLSGRDPICCLGRVVRCVPIEGYPLHEVAVRYDDIAQKDRRDLERFAGLLKEARLKGGAVR